MLDYILSRLVLLSFLFLILGLLVAYQDILGNFFLSGAAKGIAANLGEKIRSVALNLAIASEMKRIRLPPVIQSGPLRSHYKVVFGCTKEGGKKAIMGIGIKNPRGEFIYVYRVDLYLPGRTINIRYPEEGVDGGKTILLKKELTASKMDLNIYLCEDITCNTYSNRMKGC